MFIIVDIIGVQEHVTWTQGRFVSSVLSFKDLTLQSIVSINIILLFMYFSLVGDDLYLVYLKKIYLNYL